MVGMLSDRSIVAEWLAIFYICMHVPSDFPANQQIWCFYGLFFQLMCFLLLNID